jgi:putative transposase
MVGPAVKREGVAHLRATMGLSERRACSIVSADRKMVRYRSCRPPDAELRTQLRDLANERKRFGYRRLFVLLRQEGEPSGVNRIYRLYREEGLTVRKRRARRRAVGSRAPILVESKPNARWSVDFVHDQLACGRRFRILNRECQEFRVRAGIVGTKEISHGPTQRACDSCRFSTNCWEVQTPRRRSTPAVCWTA